MAKNKEKTMEPKQEEEKNLPEAEETEEKGSALEESEALRDMVAQQEEKYLRLAAEYDNYRKRTAKEKESAWSSARAETVKPFLSVYDDLERALKQETADEAYRRGVEMIMTKLQKVLADLGVEEIPALGQPFDANLHNAVMHIDDPEAGENTVVEVFQQGFLCEDKVIRFSMVKVAN